MTFDKHTNLIDGPSMVFKQAIASGVNIISSYYSRVSSLLCFFLEIIKTINKFFLRFLAIDFVLNPSYQSEKAVSIFWPKSLPKSAVSVYISSDEEFELNVRAYEKIDFRLGNQN